MEENQNKGEKIYIQSPAYYTGDILDISEIDFLKEDPDKAKAYYAMGLKTYSHSRIPMIEMAYYSAKKTLSSISIRPEEIDYLVYIAEQKGRDEMVGSGEIMALIGYLGLPGAYPIGVFLSDCANLMAGIQVAYSMIKAGQAKNVLVVSTNRVSERPGARMMQPEVAVGSDAAVSLLITGENGSFCISGIGMQKNEASAPGAPLLDQSIKKIKALRGVTRNLLNQSGLTTQQFQHVFVNNYSELSQIFIENCGFDPSRGFYDNLPKYAHCLAGDTMISLVDQSAVIENGDLLYLMTDGPNAAYGMILEKIQE